MLDKVKLALRITHTLLDSDIQDTIDTARAEMVRAGVDPNLANGDNKLVEQCIKTYCAYNYANDLKMAEGYKASFDYQLDNLRKSTFDDEGGGQCGNILFDVEDGHLMFEEVSQND